MFFACKAEDEHHFQQITAIISSHNTFSVYSIDLCQQMMARKYYVYAFSAEIQMYSEDTHQDIPSLSVQCFQ